MLLETVLKWSLQSFLQGLIGDAGRPGGVQVQGHHLSCVVVPKSLRSDNLKQSKVLHQVHSGWVIFWHRAIFLADKFPKDAFLQRKVEVVSCLARLANKQEAGGSIQVTTNHFKRTCCSKICLVSVHFEKELRTEKKQNLSHVACAGKSGFKSCRA